MFEIEEFHIHVDDEVLADLQHRLEISRGCPSAAKEFLLPKDSPEHEDLSYGVPMDYVDECLEYWKTG